MTLKHKVKIFLMKSSLDLHSCQPLGPGGLSPSRDWYLPGCCQKTQTNQWGYLSQQAYKYLVPPKRNAVTWSTFTRADCAADMVRQIFQQGSIGKGSLLLKYLTLNMLAILLKIF